MMSKIKEFLKYRLNVVFIEMRDLFEQQRIACFFSNRGYATQCPRGPSVTQASGDDPRVLLRWRIRLRAQLLG